MMPCRALDSARAIRFAWVSTFLIVVLSINGCSVWRGLPSHGGGKRFDEEQRVVSGAICRAIADMNLEELKGRKIVLIVEAGSQNGGGQVDFPRIDSIRGTYTDSENTGAEFYDFGLPTSALPTQYRNNFSDTDRRDKSVSVDIQPYLTFRPTTYPSDTDLKYLQAVLAMKADHLGIQITTKAPDATLNVLVDVLGTNLSRQDSLLFWKDVLKASCEMTYYAKDVRTNGLVFAARQSSASAKYIENSIIGFSGFRIQRSIESVPPTPFPLDTETGVPTPTPPTAEATEEEPAPAAPAAGESREELEKKLSQADMQLQSGNIDEAQRLVNQVRLADPNFPGLDDMAAKIQSSRKNSDTRNRNTNANGTRNNDKDATNDRDSQADKAKTDRLKNGAAAAGDTSNRAGNKANP